MAKNTPSTVAADPIHSHRGRAIDTKDLMVSKRTKCTTWSCPAPSTDPNLHQLYPQNEESNLRMKGRKESNTRQILNVILRKLPMDRLMILCSEKVCSMLTRK
jgi:hypothetical protein